MGEEFEYGVQPWVTGSRLVPFIKRGNGKEEQVEGKEAYFEFAMSRS